jgi:hypothetical protein
VSGPAGQINMVCRLEQTIFFGVYPQVLKQM